MSSVAFYWAFRQHSSKNQENMRLTYLAIISLLNCLLFHPQLLLAREEGANANAIDPRPADGTSARPAQVATNGPTSTNPKKGNDPEDFDWHSLGDWQAVAPVISSVGSVISAICFVTTLFLTWWTIQTTLRNNELIAKYNARNSLSSLLIDVDKQLIEWPELWCIYDNATLPKCDSPEAKAKRDAFIYQHFNMFEAAHSYYTADEKINPNTNDREYNASWNGYMSQFFNQSSDARALFESERTKNIYSARFVKEVTGLIKKLKLP